MLRMSYRQSRGGDIGQESMRQAFSEAGRLGETANNAGRGIGRQVNAVEEALGGVLDVVRAPAKAVLPNADDITATVVGGIIILVVGSLLGVM